MTKKLILAVDDEPHIARLVQVNLERAGYEVETARDGIEALERLRSDERKPDLILTDITMPYMDGYSLLKELDSDAKLRDIPVMVMTVRSRSHDIAEASSRGADDYIHKPIVPRDLLSQVARLLGEDHNDGPPETPQ